MKDPGWKVIGTRRTETSGSHIEQSDETEQKEEGIPESAAHHHHSYVGVEAAKYLCEVIHRRA